MASLRHPSTILSLIAIGVLCDTKTPAAGPATSATDTDTRPNIVLIMTDDQGYGDLGATGNPLIRTPNIDAMARRSASAAQFYVSPVCAPTRASLMTGRYNYRTRCIDTYIGRAMMEPEETTIAELLGNAGYATGIFGKWHLGDCYPMRPMDQGFSESLVHRGGGIGQPSDPSGAEGKYTDPVLFRNGVAEPQSGYCTDVYYSNALDFIRRSQQDKRPFFVYLPDNGPNTQRYVDGMRGNKTTVYEGGVRSPFFMHWPDRLEPGHEVDRVCAHFDVMPTLLEACNVSVPAGLQLDGISFLPELLQQPAKRSDRTIVIQSHRGNQPVRFHNFMIRDARWKLLNASGFGLERPNGPPQFELYDLQADPRETRNVAAGQPDVVNRLKAAYETWFAEVGSTRPDNYAPPRIHIGTPHENPTVLTRQDWRHTHGEPWQRGSVGHWLLHAADAGTYKVDCRFGAGEAAGHAVLTVNDDRWELPVSAGQDECVFEDVRLPAGPLRLEVTLHQGDRVRGIYQADVERPADQ